jgi:hypothetical protein
MISVSLFIILVGVAISAVSGITAILIDDSDAKDMAFRALAFGFTVLGVGCAMICGAWFVKLGSSSILLSALTVIGAAISLVFAVFMFGAFIETYTD